jgi:hypothetical protein
MHLKDFKEILKLVLVILMTLLEHWFWEYEMIYVEEK